MIRFLLLTLLLSSFSLSTQAARVINSVLLNGNATTTVAAGETVTVTMEVTTSGNGANNRWKSTSYTLDGSTVCVDTTDRSGVGTYTNNFNITAPADGDSYNISFYAHRNAGCNPPNDSNNISIIDGVVVAESCNVADNFTNIAYNQNDGSVNWASDWLEIGEADGPSSGIARIRNDNCTSENCLRFGVPSGGSAQTYSNIGVSREVNLTGASSATLTFNYRTGYNSGTPNISLWASDDGGSTWYVLETYSFF